MSRRPVRAGEIVGIAGVAGNGQREPAETITGRGASEGVVRVDGRGAATAIRVRRSEPGIADIPQDRLHTGVAPSLSIASNVVLKSYRETDHSRGPILRLRAIGEAREAADPASSTCTPPGLMSLRASYRAATCRRW